MYVSTALALQECKGSSNCLSKCERKCPKEKTVDVNKCKTAGREAGKRVAKKACDLTQVPQLQASGMHCGGLHKLASTAV